jgi:hypothetical protein
LELHRSAHPRELSRDVVSQILSAIDAKDPTAR